MFDDDQQHATEVDSWLTRAAKGLSPRALMQLFERALAALWTRTTTTLGEVTLTAIAERVLYNATEKFPLLVSLRVEPAKGIDCSELREQVSAVQASELRDGVRFVLVELLTVLGKLTAEILTPELHSELSRVALPEGSP